jgi:hypothetical protein
MLGGRPLEADSAGRTEDTSHQRRWKTSDAPSQPSQKNNLASWPNGGHISARPASAGVNEPLSMSEIPLYVLGTDCGRRLRFRAKALTHSFQSHTYQEVISWCHAIGTKEEVLGAIGTAGGSQRQSPGVE